MQSWLAWLSLCRPDWLQSHRELPVSAYRGLDQRYVLPLSLYGKNKNVMANVLDPWMVFKVLLFCSHIHLATCLGTEFYIETVSLPNLKTGPSLLCSIKDFVLQVLISHIELTFSCRL